MQQIRSFSAEKGGQVKAIALSGYAGDSDHQRALQVGFQQHLIKPVDPETLVTAVRLLLTPQQVCSTNLIGFYLPKGRMLAVRRQATLSLWLDVRIAGFPEHS